MQLTDFMQIVDENGLSYYSYTDKLWEITLEPLTFGKVAVGLYYGMELLRPRVICLSVAIALHEADGFLHILETEKKIAKVKQKAIYKEIQKQKNLTKKKKR